MDLERDAGGAAKIVIIASEELTARISCLGAELQQLTTGDGKDLQWGGDPAVWHGRAPVLFPVIGLLQEGRYRLDGTTYTMPKHGFDPEADVQSIFGRARHPSSSNSGVCKRLCVRDVVCRGTVVFAVGRSRRIMGLRGMVLPMFVPHASNLGSRCNDRSGMDQPTSRQGRLVTP